jgi:hypothetical protein
MFEYSYIRLVDDNRGFRSVVDDLNARGADGWELMPFLLPGGWGILKRKVATVAHLQEAA